MNRKLDLKKEYRELYSPRGKDPVVVDVPPLKYLMIDGINAEPESEGFQNGIQALFSVSYKTKFTSKKQLGSDYVVMPLEGLWWADDMNDFSAGKKETWRWTLMILQPGFVTPGLIDSAIDASGGKAPEGSLEKLRLEELHEGLSAQIMHIGPYSEEHGNIMKIHEFIRSKSGSFEGTIQKHHEIYLSDFRKTPPERLKTVLRQPFVR
jgi:hypothetical protein